MHVNVDADVHANVKLEDGTEVRGGGRKFGGRVPKFGDRGMDIGGERVNMRARCKLTCQRVPEVRGAVAEALCRCGHGRDRESQKIPKTVCFRHFVVPVERMKLCHGRV